MTIEIKTVSELEKFCKSNNTTVVIGICCNEQWIKVYKNDFFRTLKASGDLFCNYDGEPQTVTVIDNIAYVGYNVTSSETTQ